jgi:hypothetical protein
MLNIYEDGYDSFDIYRLFFYYNLDIQFALMLQNKSFESEIKINAVLANEYNKIFKNNECLPPQSIINKKLLSYYCVTQGYFEYLDSLTENEIALPLYWFVDATGIDYNKIDYLVYEQFFIQQN